MLEWVALFFGIGIAAAWYGRRQPFPRYAHSLSLTSIGTAVLLLLALSGPRPTEPRVPMIAALLIGMLGVTIGSRLMNQMKRDVVVAPFASILFASGATGLLAHDWSSQIMLQQIGSFVLASLLVMLAIYLCFRGLVIGVPGIAWSQAGLQQIERGLFDGPHGAISCFERAWDENDPSLDAMSKAALCRIHSTRGDSTELAANNKLLQRHGGFAAVDSEWIRAIDSALKSCQLQPGPLPSTEQE